MPLSRRDEGTKKLPIVISQGEPSGIGPEIAIKAFFSLNGRIAGRRLRLIGNAAVFRAAAKTCGLNTDEFADAIVDMGGTVTAEPGKPSPANAGAVTAAIAEGARACAAKEAAALVTAPIQKSVLTAAGFGFPGHTEYLGHLLNIAKPVMMLASRDVDPPLRVVPFTIHIPLREVMNRLEAGALVSTAEIVLDALARDFGCAHPRLAVAGLNPHAGEDGTIGREDLDVIAPAVAQLRSRRRDVTGPLSADTLFHEDARKTYDAALCMYHDQALIPIKTLAFWTGVNVTLGLPIVRTSPDHGTALSLAGRGIANAKSMIAAIEMAAEIAERRGL
jgi:4-hydroxythreonine-4-phosphate dehydrogenase